MTCVSYSRRMSVLDNLLVSSLGKGYSYRVVYYMMDIFRGPHGPSYSYATSKNA